MILTKIVLRLVGIIVLAGLVEVPFSALGQDSSGRPTSAQDPTGRPKIRKTGKPKKVIRVKPATNDVDTVPTASVIIRSYPPGAEVYVDDVAVGTTADDGELELSDVRLGAHKIVLKKDGYREWSQVVTLRTSTDKQEIEPLLQSESAQFVHDKSKLQPIEYGKEIAGQISRDGMVMREGGFYNEYLLRVEKPDAFVIALKAKSVTPKLRLVDDSNKLYAIEPAGTDVYHTGFLPAGGDYFLQVVGAVDESSFTAGEYTMVVLPETQAHADRTISIGETADGVLESTDRLNGPGDYFDGFKFDGQAGLVVRIVAKTNGGFQPSLTLLLDGKVVARSVPPSTKKKKKADAIPYDAAEIQSTLTSGTYTLYIRSATGPKLGHYQLSVSIGG